MSLWAPGLICNDIILFVCILLITVFFCFFWADYRKLLDTAKAEGVVTTKWTNISVVGASGTGKSSMLNLLLNKEPILEHHSTPVVKAAEVLVVDEDPNTDSDESSSSSDESSEEEDGDETVSEIGQHVIIADPSGSWKATSGETTKTKLAQALKQRIQPKSSAGLPHKPIPLMRVTKRNMERLASQLLPESRPEVDDDMNTKLQHYPMSHANMELLELLYSVRQSEELYKCHWIYVTDSGGQAAFLDIAPALMRYNSANLIVIKLDEKLDSLADFFYSVHGRKVGEGEKRKITTRQLIKNFFYCKSQLKMPHLEGVENVQQHGETCFLILATHLDKYKKLKKSKKLEESLEKKNECLLEDLQSYRDVRRDFKSSKKQIIFPLNTLSREDRQLKTAKKIRDLTAESYIEGEVPVRWFIFHIDLQQKASGCNMISLDECYKIGESSNMKPDEVKAALCYFHSLTVYLYFHSILPLVVFINPQPLFDRLSEIMAVSFGSSRHSAQTIEDLQNKGIFRRTLLDRMTFDKHLFTADDFLKLMKELLIISELHDNSGYFIPCVLKIDDEPYEPVSNDEIEPLILVWENASIPNGLFPALVVHLLGLVSSQVHGVDYPKQFCLGEEICRNKVTLKCRDLGGTLVLVDHVDWLAIFYFSPFKYMYCSTIRCIILQGLVEVVTRFEWKSALAYPQEMFQCKCTVVLPSVFHLCEYNKGSATLTCSKSKVCIKGSVTRHLSWFCEKGI